MKRNDFKVAVFDGDGIGPEIMAPTLELVGKAVSSTGSESLSFEHFPAGAEHYKATGEALPEASLEGARAADAIFLGAMGLPDIRYPNQTEISPQIDLRVALGLFAGVRPVFVFPGQPTPLADPRAESVNFVLIRESTEGLFHSRDSGTITDDREGRETLLITRETSEKLFDFAFRLAGKRQEAGIGQGRVTCVDKANVFQSFAFFRKIFHERANCFPELTADAVYVDAMAMRMVREPWTLDVLVTENMFGDILSDLGAALMGGLGFASSADIGDDHAVFQPCHGSAPDIAGRGWANPAAMILSGAMMLDWLGEKHQSTCLRDAGERLRGAVAAVIAKGGVRTRDWGGTAATEEFSSAVGDALDRQ